MDGAALLLLVSGVGVGFGWQPMPDGSPRYEYVVQIEPELAATLAEGQAIPIVSDVPEEVHPIGRIRLVVGKGEPPRQRLVMRLKPATEAATGSSGGVQVAQYNGPADPRYGTAPAQPNQPIAGQQHAAAMQWNHQPAAAAAITPTPNTQPTGQQLFDQPPADNVAWNTGSNATASPVLPGGPLSRVGEGLQRATEPLRDGFDRVDNRIRTAADALGDRTKSLVDELGRPFAQPSPGVPTDNRLPSTATAGATEAPAWNGGSPQGSMRSFPPRAEAPAAESNWNNTPPTTSQIAESAPAPRYPASQPNNDWNNGAQPMAQENRQDPSGAPPLVTADEDPWAKAADPRPRAGTNNVASSNPADISNVATRPNSPFGGAGSSVGVAGPQFPDLGAGMGNPQAAQPSASPAGLTNKGSSLTATPRVLGNMLQQQPDRPLDGTTANVAAGSSTTTTGHATAGQAANPFGRPFPATPTAAAQPADALATGGHDKTAIVLMAWVLLSGSVAGNLYLFWSYVDVRQKYRAQVRKSARAVGRYSAA